MFHIAWSLIQSYSQARYHKKMSCEQMGTALYSHSIEEQSVSFPLSILNREAELKDHGVLLVIDALDECFKDERKALINLLLKLSTSRVKIFITSRPIPELDLLR